MQPSYRSVSHSTESSRDLCPPKGLGDGYLFISFTLFFFFFFSLEMRTYEDAILDEAELLVKNINKVQRKTITLDKRLTGSIVKSMCVSNERC